MSTKWRSLDCFLCYLQCLSHCLLLQIKSSIEKSSWENEQGFLLHSQSFWEKMQLCAFANLHTK